MHEILAKIARLAFSKGAAFCYAVTVGVSGQLAYNYLQPHDRGPQTIAVAAPSPTPAAPFGAAVLAPIPPARPPEAAPSPASLAARAGDAKEATASATLPILPESPALSLPSPSALPAPVLRPAALPPSRPAAAASVEPSAAPVDQTAMPPAGTADTAVATPIPLLPSDGVAEIEKAAIPVRPGPGSGGLY